MWTQTYRNQNTHTHTNARTYARMNYSGNKEKFTHENKSTSIYKTINSRIFPPFYVIDFLGQVFFSLYKIFFHWIFHSSMYELRVAKLSQFFRSLNQDFLAFKIIGHYKSFQSFVHKMFPFLVIWQAQTCSNLN